jgi:ABC-type uncharacterized transport system permease subunit
MSFQDFLPSLIAGVSYGIASIGVAATIRYLRDPDFTWLGSIMLGGIVAIDVTRHTGPIVGILSGILAGGGLGLITALLTCTLKIPLVLSGILTYTASLTCGFTLSKSGTASLAVNDSNIFTALSSLRDLAIVSGIAIILCALAGMFVLTKAGSLMLAMTGSEKFLRYRHRYRTTVTVSLLVYSNAIIALGGALYALKIRTADVRGQQDFLTLTLGAIFGIRITARILAHFLKDDVSGEPDPDSNMQRSNPHLMGFVGGFGRIFSSDHDDTWRLGYITATYVLGCAVLSTIYDFVRIQNVPGNYQYLITACLIIVIACVGSLKMFRG